MTGKRLVQTVACKVSRGMFSTEREIFITANGGGEVTVLVDERSVVEPRQPRLGESIDGRVKVSVVGIDTRTGLALVDLPRPAFAVGCRIEVARELLEC